MARIKKDKYDYLILGAGIFGLYTALLLGKSKKGSSIAVLEYDSKALSRASAVNQARLHNGYHYPRSLDTAIKASHYYDRFAKDFDFAINNNFTKIYGVSKDNSQVSLRQYINFCKKVGIPLVKIDESLYFKKGTVEGTFEVEEFGFDYKKIKKYLLSEISKFNNIKIFYNTKFDSVTRQDNEYILHTSDEKIFNAPTVINTTYASINQVISKFNLDYFDIKYELCELIFCKVSPIIKKVGITVIDGPFFSVMPFGNERYHSLSAVSHTPHETSFGRLPSFKCQRKSINCSRKQLENCNTCKFKPETAWLKMSSIAGDFLRDDIKLEYINSIYSIKPILTSSDKDDSRPTVIKTDFSHPCFISVLSGKISTIYDMEDVVKKI